MKTVLVIEDNPDNLRLITVALEHGGYSVISAESGEAGIALAVQERPLFIIMDINLPGMDGLEATRRLRGNKITAAIPIIAMTSHAMLGNQAHIMAAGCNGYFEKPIDPITVVERIEKIIEDGKLGKAEDEKMRS